MAYYPTRSPKLITYLFSHSPTRTFVFQFPVSPHFSLCYPSYSMFWLIHRNIFFSIFNSYTLSLIQVLLVRSSCLPLRTQFLRLLFPSFLLFRIINSQPYHNQSLPLLTSIGSLFWCRLLRIVLRFFGCCPRVGLFAAATLCRFWNSVATNVWLDFAFGCFLRFQRCLCFAKPR